MLGNDLGALPLVVAVAVAFGVGAIVAGSVFLFTVIKMLGAGYLIYLGVQAEETVRTVSRRIRPVEVT